MDANWQRQVLENEGLLGWTIREASDAYCWIETKTIQLPLGASPVLFLHEVAHALHPIPEPNHYHGGGWSSAFGWLVEKYMTVIEVPGQEENTMTKIRFGFKGRDQLPLFMVWREYIEDGEVFFAKVLFNSRDWIGF